jgi:hypothetical protein
LIETSWEMTEPDRKGRSRRSRGAGYARARYITNISLYLD